MPTQWTREVHAHRQSDGRSKDLGETSKSSWDGYVKHQVGHDSPDQARVLSRDMLDTRLPPAA